MRDHEAIVIDSFRGLFDRGENQAIPNGHLKEAKNVRFRLHGIETRPGTSEVFGGVVVSNVVRTYSYIPPGGPERQIFLTNDGKLWDSTSLAGYPGAGEILNIAAMTDFSAINMFGWLYITPHDGNLGLMGDYVYVYKGVPATPARVTGCARPNIAGPPAMAAAIGAAGNCEPGDHLFTVVYLTDTGFVSPIPQAPSHVLLNLPGPGGVQVNITNIPVPPAGAGVVKKYILATKVITGGYTGDPNQYELFFVPSANGGVIDPAIALTTLNFFDSELIDSADYLRDELEHVPAGLGLTDYNGRMCVWGCYGAGQAVRVSKSGEPESHTDTDGFLNVGPGDYGWMVKDVIAWRGNLYIAKPSRLYVTQDTGYQAAYWQIEQIDNAIGCDLHGFSDILDDSKGSTEECFLIAAHSGLYKFNGTLGDKPLTWKIETYWRDSLYHSRWNEIQVLVDTFNRELYVFVPVKTGATHKHILVGDFSEGLDWENIKWAIWTLSSSVSGVTGSIEVGATQIPKLYLASPTFGMCKLDQTVNTDLGDGYDATFTTGAIPDNEEGEINHYTAVSLRVRGGSAPATNDFQISIYDQDFNLITSANRRLLGASAKDAIQLINVNTEKAFFKFKQTTDSPGTEWFQIYKIRIFCKPIWTGRPMP